jgi:tetrahydromethanopterin S-methyltransferase subunit G
VPPRNSRNLLSALREVGKYVVVIGVIITLVGLVMWSGFAPKWLGRLPGDIRIEREHSAFYFPIVTCIILSIVLSLLFSIFRR